MSMGNNRHRHKFTVQYETESHFKVLTQRWGSVWPKVLPYCIINLILSLVLSLFKDEFGWNLGMTDKGHAYVSLLLAFLIVTRANVSIARYNEVRGCLNVMFSKSQELIQRMALASIENDDDAGKEWRLEMAYRVLIMVRSVMAVIDYPSDMVPGWELPEVDYNLATKLRRTLFLEGRSRRWAHHSRLSENEENMRVPIRLAEHLRHQIRQGKKVLNQPFTTSEENSMYSSLDGFMAGYVGVRKFLTTPFPFPVVQMARTFLFFYVFTVPFALLSDSSKTFVHAIVIFFFTYGFMGLECVSIEMDDPFGDDDNDFDNDRMAEMHFEDTYTVVLHVDGPEWTDRLRLKMHDPSADFDLPPEAAEWLASHKSDGVTERSVLRSQRRGQRDVIVTANSRSFDRS